MITQAVTIRKRFNPLTTTVNLKVLSVGSGPTQVYDPARNEYFADRTNSPLVIIPEVTAFAIDGTLEGTNVDGEKKAIDIHTLTHSDEWQYATSLEDSWLDISNKSVPLTKDTDYTIDTTASSPTCGALTLKKNNPSGSVYYLRYKGAYTDPRTNSVFTVYSDPVEILTRENAVPKYRLYSDSEKIISYNPLEDEAHQELYFKLKRGADIVSLDDDGDNMNIKVVAASGSSAGTVLGDKTGMKAAGTPVTSTGIIEQNGVKFFYCHLWLGKTNTAYEFDVLLEGTLSIEGVSKTILFDRKRISLKRYIPTISVRNENMSPFIPGQVRIDRYCVHENGRFVGTTNATSCMDVTWLVRNIGETTPVFTATGNPVSLDFSAHQEMTEGFDIAFDISHKSQIGSDLKTFEVFRSASSTSTSHPTVGTLYTELYLKMYKAVTESVKYTVGSSVLDINVSDSGITVTLYGIFSYTTSNKTIGKNSRIKLSGASTKFTSSMATSFG